MIFFLQKVKSKNRARYQKYHGFRVVCKHWNIGQKILLTKVVIERETKFYNTTRVGGGHVEWEQKLILLTRLKNCKVINHCFVFLIYLLILCNAACFTNLVNCKKRMVASFCLWCRYHNITVLHTILTQNWYLPWRKKCLQSNSRG